MLSEIPLSLTVTSMSATNEVIIPHKSISGRTIAAVHTILSLSAFTSALVVGIYYHYQKLCRNSVARYPVEWFPRLEIQF